MRDRPSVALAACILLLMTVIMSSACARATEVDTPDPAETPQAAESEQDSGDTILMVERSLETSVPASVLPLQAAELIWASIKDESSPAIPSPIVDYGAVGSEGKPSPVEARSVMQVRHVIPLAALAPGRPTPTAELASRLRLTGGYAAVAAVDGAACAFEISTSTPYWRYDPQAPVALPALGVVEAYRLVDGGDDDVALLGLEGEDAISWWLVHTEPGSLSVFVGAWAHDPVTSDLEIGHSYSDAQVLETGVSFLPIPAED
ncbi:MAG: hypothetical protein Q8K99_04525 [Actinomycetota bacterium]|nr:hypothetical protein [Actinomycetota bacterium]